MVSEQALKDTARIVRITMIVIMLTAGTSKLFSQGGFPTTIPKPFRTT